MAAGQCAAIVVVGKIHLQCPCQQGIFNIQPNTLTQVDEECQQCGHSLSLHKNFSISGQNSISHCLLGLAATNKTTDISQREPLTPTTSTAEMLMESEVPSDPLTSLRENTVAKLWEQVQLHRVIHIRGTPGSGKTFLARLLRFYLWKTMPNLKIYSTSWPNESKFKENGLHKGSYYHELLNVATSKPMDARFDWLELKNTLLIIDEAQRSYEYDSLWADFLRSQAGRGRKGGILVILLSSFGSPSEAPVQVKGSAPMSFAPEQRVSVRPLPNRNNPEVSLYFTLAEFKDVVTRTCNYYNTTDPGKPFLPSLEVLDYIWALTNGHPAGTRAVLDALVYSEVSLAYTLFASS
jgi:hypothetical protein